MSDSHSVIQSPWLTRNDTFRKRCQTIITMTRTEVANWASVLNLNPLPEIRIEIVPDINTHINFLMDEKGVFVLQYKETVVEKQFEYCLNTSLSFLVGRCLYEAKNRHVVGYKFDPVDYVEFVKELYPDF